MLISLPVRDVMTRAVETVGVGATAAEVADRIAGSEHTSVVVCDGREPAGIVTESDVVRLYAGDAARDTSVTEFMSADLVTVGPDEPVERAAEILGEHDVRRLPVVEDGRIVGIVTAADIAYYFPHVVRDRRGWAERSARRPATESTAYEDENWEFESRGTGDGLDVGDVVRFTKEVSDADVEAFAEATGDTNRLHLDEAFAERSRFGRRIVHGVLGAGVVSGALARIPGLTVFLSLELSFLAPVDIGERVTAVCEVVEDLGRRKYRLSTELFGGEGECVIDGEAVVLLDDVPEETDATGADVAAADDPDVQPTDATPRSR